MYQQLVGSLIYLTLTRPDISYAVGVVSRYMQNPRKPNWEAIRCILRYVKGTKTMVSCTRKVKLASLLVIVMLTTVEIMTHDIQLLDICLA